MLLHSFSLFFPLIVSLAFLTSVQHWRNSLHARTVCHRTLLYNRLIFYSYYLPVIWIWVIRKGEENTHKSSVEIEWTAGIHLPQSTGGGRSLWGHFSLRKLQEPRSSQWKLTGSSLTAISRGQTLSWALGPQWEGKQNNCRGVGGKVQL